MEAIWKRSWPGLEKSAREAVIAPSPQLLWARRVYKQ
jgi:hypothetical protein